MWAFVVFAIFWRTDSRAEVEVKPAYVLKYSITTTAQKENIWHLWQDVENWKKFDTLLEYSKLDPPYEFKENATGIIKAEGAPRTRFELIDVNPGVSFVEKLNVPLFQSIELHRYFEEGHGDKTVFTHEVHFKGRLRFLIYWLAAKSFKKELPLVMGRLKELAEQGHDPRIDARMVE